MAPLRFQWVTLFQSITSISMRSGPFVMLRGGSEVNCAAVRLRLFWCWAGFWSEKYERCCSWSLLILLRPFLGARSLDMVRGDVLIRGLGDGGLLIMGAVREWCR